MKTSNKLLLSGLILCCLLIFVGLIIVKNNSVFHQAGDIDKSGNPQSTTLSNHLKSNKLNLHGGMYNYYTLDPNLTGISISADKKVIEQIRITDEDGLYFYREGDLNLDESNHTVITIGIKDKSKLDIHLKGNAKLNTIGKIDAVLNIVIEDNCKLELQYEGPKLNIKASENSEVELIGNSRVASIHMDGNAKSPSTDFKVDSLKTDLADNAMLSLHSTKKISGFVKQNSLLKMKETWIGGDVEKSDNAKVTIDQ